MIPAEILYLLFTYAQTLRKEALEAYLAGGLKEASIVMQVHT